MSPPDGPRPNHQARSLAASARSPRGPAVGESYDHQPDARRAPIPECRGSGCRLRGLRAGCRLRPWQRRRRQAHLAPPAGARRTLEPPPAEPPRIWEEPTLAARGLRARGAVDRRAARGRRAPRWAFIRRGDCAVRSGVATVRGALAHRVRARLPESRRRRSQGRRADRPRRAALRTRRRAIPLEFLHAFRGGVGSTHETPERLTGELLDGVRLL